MSLPDLTFLLSHHALASPGLLVLTLAFLLGCASAFLPGITLYPTLVHELGHALLANLAGSTLKGLRVNRDASGVTHSLIFSSLAAIPSLLAGYPAPSLAALALMVLLPYSGSACLLLVGLFTLALLLSRSLLTFLLAVLALIGSTSLLYASHVVQVSTLTFLAGLLTLGGLRATLSLWQVGYQSPHSDSGQLARLTHVPARFFAGLFLFLAFSPLAGLIILPVLS